MRERLPYIEEYDEKKIVYSFAVADFIDANDGTLVSYDIPEIIIDIILNHHSGPGNYTVDQWAYFPSAYVSILRALRYDAYVTCKHKKDKIIKFVSIEFSSIDEYLKFMILNSKA